MRTDIKPHRLKKHERDFLKEYGANHRQYLHIYTGPDFIRFWDKKYKRAIEIRR